MKHVKFAITFLVSLALLIGVSVLTAAAAGVLNADPNTAAYIDNQTHSIAPDSALWYRFDYAGDRSAITVTLVNGTNSGLQFNVFTPEEATSWWDTPPIGRGTALTLDCSTGLPVPNGQCQSNDLTWVGQFNAPGTYYVQVVNTNPGAMNFQWTIQGTGVTLAPQAPAATLSSAGLPSPAPTLSATPAMPSAAPGLNTDPGHAAVLDNNSHSIPANGSLWYRFGYSGNRSAITITLVNGTNSGLGFNVFTPDQVGSWWNTPPIGRGTPQATSCNTGVPQESGGCQAHDLTWVGSFNAAGTYYVQVTNLNGSPASAWLTIQGSGVLTP